MNRTAHSLGLNEIRPADEIAVFLCIDLTEFLAAISDQDIYVYSNGVMPYVRVSDAMTALELYRMGGV